MLPTKNMAPLGSFEFRDTVGSFCYRFCDKKRHPVWQDMQKNACATSLSQLLIDSTPLDRVSLIRLYLLELWRVLLSQKHCQIGWSKSPKIGSDLPAWLLDWFFLWKVECIGIPWAKITGFYWELLFFRIFFFRERVPCNGANFSV